MGWFFAFFVLSGFCGLVYQVVWLRVAMASFGVTTPMVSIVLSVFMAGLAIGSWAGGRLARRLESAPPGRSLCLYAAAELLIGVSGVVVVPLLGVGHALLAGSGDVASWGSSSYYLASAAWVAAALLPFCTCMGATFPFAMAGVRAIFRDESPRSFSYLYVANVAGAMAGTLGSAFVLIELVGFRATTLLAAGLNATVAAGAFVAARRLWPAAAGRRAAGPAAGAAVAVAAAPMSRGLALVLLGTTGLVSLALEVVWTRQFVPFQGPVVYAFATVLAVYLAATIAGSWLYRAWARGRKGGPGPWASAASLAGVTALFSLAAADPRLPLGYGLLPGALRVVLGVGPFCGVLGFLTPMLVDQVSSGDPDRAGTAYAVNTVGCIVGPLASGFVLLPLLGERWTTVLLCVPFFAFAGASALGRPGTATATSSLPARRLALAVFESLLLVAITKDFETVHPERIVRRDHTATVIATGGGMNKRLVVNGQGMTKLTPITKMMAHLPLAMLDRPPERGLVLCLGMGTSFRSMMTWGIPSTVVELVPTVPSLLGFYHADADAIVRSPLAQIVVDDARRFLERTGDRFDVIVVDPPPPVEAAASSLLYSTEFYTLVRRRLSPGGILQQWLPQGDTVVVSAVTRGLAATFPYVRGFRSIEDWGFHFLASDRPIPIRGSRELSARMPALAVADLIEWGPETDPVLQIAQVLRREIPVQRLIDFDPAAMPLSDDLPVNEYYFLRRLTGRSKEGALLLASP